MDTNLKTHDGFTYNLSTGCFYGKSGKLLKATPNKYQRIKFLGKSRQAHHVAYYMVNGKFPVNCIDHINRVKSDNRWCNLREASKQENNCNTKIRVDNNSGHKGVSWKRKNKRWCVQISVNKKVLHIGLFKDFELACLVADEAREKYHGKFASNG